MGVCIIGACTGTRTNKEALLKRLRRAEGQVAGIARMVENDDYCIDILTQVSAATKALEAVALSLLGDHLSHCVAEATALNYSAADVLGGDRLYERARGRL